MLLLPIAAGATQSWYLPQTNLYSDLWIENNNARTVYIWIQTPPLNDQTSDGQNEVSFELSAHEKLAIPLGRFQKEAWLHIKAHDEDSVNVAVLSENTKIWLKQNSSNTYMDWVRQKGYLYLSNTYPYPITSTVSYNQENLTVTIDPNSTWQSPEALTLNSRIQVTSSNRLPAMVASSDAIQALHFAVPTRLNTDKNAVYFLLSNSRKSESFVVRMTDAKQIQEARNQLNHTQTPRILNARITTESQDYNRDFNHANRAPWGWSVSEINSFADFCHIDLDGSPSSVDQFLPLWLAKGSTICFWDYYLEKELTPEQVSLGRE